MISTSHQILFGDQVEKNEVSGARSIYGVHEVHTRF